MTHGDHPNCLLILQCWQAAGQGDPDTLRALWAENIVWHVTANTPWRGDHVGQEAVLEYLAQVGDLEDPYDLTLQAVFANDDYGVVVFHVETQRDGHSLSVDQILFGRFEERRIAEIWTFSLDAQAIEEFWNDMR
ncbi:MAG: nuclear transport factor 2 family protein [Myxococcota bacterium]